MQTRSDISEFLRFYAVIARRSAHTIRAYRHALDQYAAHLTRQHRRCARRATADDVASYLYTLAEHQDATVRARMSAVRAFHRWLHRTGRSRHDPTELIPPIQVRRRPRSVHSVEQIDAVRQAGTDPRVPCIVALLYDCALRVSEAAGVRTGSIDTSGWTLTVTRKGGALGTVPIPLARRGVFLAQMQLAERGHLLPGRTGTGHLHTTSLHRLLGDAAEHVGLDRKAWHPHSLRHSRATHLRGVGVDPFTIQRLLGHSRLDMTSGYVHDVADAGA